MIARVLLWSLFESKTTIDELRRRPTLPDLRLPAVRDLIGTDPEVSEEFDVL